jgi:beta-fructofuranosidase
MTPNTLVVPQGGTAEDDLGVRAWRDQDRPRFHFAAPGGWLNDPNGLGHWGETFHLFYQYNPVGPVHNRIHWGHATSTDLVHWTDEPIALTPGDGPDRDGCWSGVLVNADGVPTLVYSGHRDGEERACLAVGDSTLRTWTPLPEAIIPEPPAGLDLTAYRDHCVWREGSTWHQIMGSGITGRGGAALHYTSENLRDWRYEGVLVAADDLPPGSAWTGTVWECVDLFAVGDRHVLILSVWDADVTHHSAYCWGHYANGRFVPESVQVFDHGLRHFYAPQTMTDAAGRRIAFGWIQEARPPHDVLQAGWGGVMSLPRQLQAGPDGRLVQAPVAEIEQLRGHHEMLPAGPLQPWVQHRLDGLGGVQLDIVAELWLRDLNACVVLALRCSPDEEEITRIVLDRSSGNLRLDRGSSSRNGELDTVELQCPLDLGADGHITLRVLLDRSVLEIFVNGHALTGRIHPTRDDAVGTYLAALSGGAFIERLDAWTMADCWTGPRAIRPTFPSQNQEI